MQNGKHGKNNNMVDLDFYKNKKIFITGHTGFKGTWLSKILIDLGAIVKGYSLKQKENSLFKKIAIEEKMISSYGDIRDYDTLRKEFDIFNPEIVIHMAAQPLVIESYNNPKYTFETNVMGTVNILECVKNNIYVKSVLNVTTDKVYENNDNGVEFVEDDKLNGYDPYSNSKSCSELVTNSYKKSFLEEKGIAVSTARAGNVIGGGDYSENRIIPDCIKAAKNNENILIRNPNGIRPYQHVLDALNAYLLIIQKQYKDIELADNYNVGPDEKDIIKNKELVKIFCEKWGNVDWGIAYSNGPHESNFLQLNCNRIRNRLNWIPTWNIDEAITKVVEFGKYDENKLEECMEKQVNNYFYNYFLKE